MRPIRLLVAPDSFKGSLSSVELAGALADGWRRARPEDAIALAPLADGGEGTLEAFAAAGGWEWQECLVADPVGRPIAARWLRSTDGARAVVELAAASGLSRLGGDRGPLRPLEATTRGTGELLCAVLDAGVRHVVLGIGGSATTDGGSGILAALGARFGGGREPLPGPIPEIAAADLSGLDPRLDELELRVACDVTNPLLGEHGAAAVYGPQKGASRDDVATLDRWLGHYADLIEAASGRGERETAGAGAAGGTGFGLLAIRDRLRGFELVSGVALVMEETGFEERLGAADLVLTGEGRVDAQTAFGKTAFGVARRAHEAGVECIVVGGAVEADGADALAGLGAVAVPVCSRPMPLEEAMADSKMLATETGERLARLVELGWRVGEEELK